MTTDLVAGVDVATAEVRAVAADASGRIHARASRPLPPPLAPRPGWSEQDAGSWWPATAAALSELTGDLGARARGIRAVAVSATSGTVVALDGSGEPAGPALTYADQRAVAEASAAQAAAPERWAALGLTVAPSFGLPKMGWLVQRSGMPVCRLAHASDVLVNRLTGTLSPTDTSHALKSGFDPPAGDWVNEALEALGIDRSLLPEVRLPGTSAGALCPEAAQATGLPPGADVRLGMTDSCAAQLGAGAAEPGRFVSVLGSTLVLKGASRRLVADPSGAVYSHYHPAGWWLPGGASSTGGRSLTTRFPGRDLRELDEAAAARGPAGVVTYPLTGRGERFPFASPEAVAFTLGQPSDEAEAYRALLEGVAFVERLGYARLAELGAAPEGPVASAGRGSTSEVWNRIRATVVGRPLVAIPEAGAALGACILAACGTLHPDLRTATSEMAATGRMVQPDPGEAEALDRSYRRFCREVAGRGWLAGRE